MESYAESYEGYEWGDNSYYEIEVIAAGAVDEFQTFATYEAKEAFLAKEAADDASGKTDVPVEVFVTYHEHPERAEEYEECGCSEYGETYRYGPSWDSWLAESDRRIAEAKEAEADIANMDGESLYTGHGGLPASYWR